MFHRDPPAKYKTIVDEHVVNLGWLQDPTRRHQTRYWDGRRWTERVSDNGQQTIDVLAEQPSAPVRPTIEPEARTGFWPLPALPDTGSEQLRPTVSGG